MLRGRQIHGDLVVERVCDLAEMRQCLRTQADDEGREIHLEWGCLRGVGWRRWRGRTRRRLRRGRFVVMIRPGLAAVGEATAVLDLESARGVLLVVVAHLKDSSIG